MFTFEALQFFVFLIPGFISEAILNILVVRKDKTDLGRIIEALIFSLIIYVAFSLIISKSPISLTMVSDAKEGNAVTYTLYNNGLQFLWLLGFSLVLPLMIGWSITKDLHMKLFRQLGFTGRTSRLSVWQDLFLNTDKYVIVNFEDGRRLTGFPQYYSEDPSSQYLYLCKAAWINHNEEKNIDEYTPLENTDGILITPEQKIDSIMFLNNP